MDFSIVLPTRNRRTFLARSIASLIQQETDANFEVVVVDNASTDGTPDLLNDLSPRHKQLRRVEERVPGLLAARHRGVLETNGDILVFVDDDICADPGWLDSIRDVFQDVSVAFAGGPSRPIYRCPTPAWLDSLWIENEDGRRCEWLSLLDLGEKKKRINPNFIWGLNFSVRRQALIGLGGFHPDNIPRHLQRFQGDGETGLTKQALLKGVSAVYVPSISVQHEVPPGRLTYEYMKKRAFYQGVADSYADIRGGATPSQRLTPKTILKKMFRRFESRMIGASPLQTVIRDGYRSGYSFHQLEATSKPEVLDWIRRAAYWDYDLPGGVR